MTIHQRLRWSAAFLLLVSGAGRAVAQSTLPADLDPDSRARLPYLQRKDMGEAAQKIFDVLPGRSPEGVLSGPLAFAAYNPGVAKALFDLHNAAVGGTLDAHTRELAILVACRETNYSLEWNAHEAAAVIRFGRQMLGDRTMDSATFANAVELFGRHGAMDLVAVMSTYAVSGLYAIAVDERMRPGRPDLERVP
jgi:hypothetical protein